MYRQFLSFVLQYLRVNIQHFVLRSVKTFYKIKKHCVLSGLRGYIAEVRPEVAASGAVYLHGNFCTPPPRPRPPLTYKMSP
jgi:hypothetical protein